MQQSISVDKRTSAVVRAFAQPHAADAEIEAFIAHFTPLVEGPVRKILSPCAGCDVEQAVVDVFFRLWQKRAALPPNETIVFYILRVAHNVAVDAYRKHKRCPPTEPLLPEEGAPQGSAAALDGSPQNAAQTYAEVREMLLILPPEVRTLFWEYYGEGQSISEIARRYKMKQPTVYTKLRRARIFLRKCALREQPQTKPTHRRERKNNAV